MNSEIEYSIVVPCYNEAENIPLLLSGFAAFMTNDNEELILVNNGSTDKTAEMETELKKLYPFLRWVHIEKNIGYGHGIYTGLKHAKGKYLGYTHADLQTDPNDVYCAFSIIKEMPENNNSIVKGYRLGRNFISRIFSRVFEKLASLILKYPFKEINAQPVVFSSGIMKNMTDPPLHWGFDLYVYYISCKSNCTIKRLNVLFPSRKYGHSKWHKGVLSRITFSFKLLKYCFELKKIDVPISTESGIEKNR
jgi:glycosyltransferase involved in cell wall biosynthesis